MGCSASGIFGMWDVQDVEYFVTWDVQIARCLGFGVFRIWDVVDVRCSGNGIFGISIVWNV